jgi:arginase
VRVLTSAFHLDQPLPGLPVDGTALRLEPAGATQLERVASMYRQVAHQVAAAVSDGETPLVAAGDCSTSIGILAGLQRAGLDPGIVWFDAHGDFNTAASSTSGYVGGMPLAMAVGLDDLGLAQASGLSPLDASRVVLTDARDLDPPERALLEASPVRRLRVPDLTTADVPDGPVYVHLDLDVITAEELPGLLYPVTDGAGRAEVAAAVQRVLRTGRVAAIGLACTFTAEALLGDEARDLVASLQLTG